MEENHFFTKSSALKVIRHLVLILMTIMLVLTGIYAWPALYSRFTIDAQANQSGGSFNNTNSTEFFPIPVSTLLPTITNPTPLETSPNFHNALSGIPFAPLDQGLIVLSINHGGYQHLYAYQQQGMPLTLLTNGEWHDIHPALSPDGQWLAYASNREGQWDIYLMSMTNTEIQRLTNTSHYEGYPSWSPDGKWLVYEGYLETGETSNLDLFIQPVDGSQPAIQLTTEPGADHSPDWSPGGRQIVFVSTRNGQSDIWMADLDQIDDRFTNISHNQDSEESSPKWSPDGSQLAWASQTKDGIQSVHTWDAITKTNLPSQLGSGSMSAWSPDGGEILSIIQTPNQYYLTAYDKQLKSLSLSPFLLPGEVMGITWRSGKLPEYLPASFDLAAHLSPTPPWVSIHSNEEALPGNRYRLVELTDIQASNPLLTDEVDESFVALRARVALETGWDFLGSLEQTFIPLSSPGDPGVNQDWLYTGRAFRFNTAPVNAGWVVVLREDFGSQTYWRILLKTRYQDGSQGRPVDKLPWNFNTRHSGDPLAYEQGGSYDSQIPPGYWFDFTSLAASYGWERQPALPTWRVAYSSIRYNEFVLRSGLDWLSAMLQIYPRQAIDTPTPVPPPTFTPTITFTPTPSTTPTRTPYYTRTPRPTSTPWPTRTSPPTRTPTPTQTN